MNINTSNIKSLQKALNKAYNEPRGIFDSYSSLLNPEDKQKLQDLHKESKVLMSKSKFAEKIRKGEYKIKTVILLEIL